VCAIILLSIGIISQLYALYNSPNPFTTISSFCKARSYLNQTSAMSCRWLLVMACIDRYISSSTNTRNRWFSSVAMARRIVVIIVCIWFILPIHVLIYSNIRPPGNIACSITNGSIAVYHRFYTVIMGGALPSIISFICSLFIWRNFQDKRRRRTITFNNILMQKRKKVQDQQILLMLFVQVVIFVISTIPFMSFNIYDTMTRSVTNKSADRKAIEAFCKTSTELLVYLITLSFYSNTLVSRTFRRELITLFKLIITYNDQQHCQRIKPSNSTTTRNNTLQTMMTMRTAKTSYA
jgi:L-lactate permease